MLKFFLTLKCIFLIHLAYVIYIALTLIFYRCRNNHWRFIRNCGQWCSCSSASTRRLGKTAGKEDSSLPSWIYRNWRRLERKRKRRYPVNISNDDNCPGVSSFRRLPDMYDNLSCKSVQPTNDDSNDDHDYNGARNRCWQTSTKERRQ